MPSSAKFDYTAARNSGATDEQIAQYLASKRAQGIDVYVDRSEFQSASGITPTASQGQLTRTPPRVLGYLPAIGGAVGGLGGGVAGGPLGAIAGAGIGGAWGEGQRQSLSHVPMNAGRIAGQGAIQGGLEVAGGGLAVGAGRLAGGMMRRALGVGRAAPGDAFGDVAKTALERGIGVSPRGVAKATRLREESSQALYDMLNQARASGTRLNTRQVTKHVRDLLRSNVIPSEEKDQIMRKLVSFLGDKTARMDPVLLKEIKQFYQNRASSAYSAVGGMTEAQAPGVAFSEQLARGAQTQLERIPGVGAREAQTQGLIGTERAVEKAFKRPPRALELHKPGSWPAPFLNSPRAVSNYALFLNHPWFKQFLRQNPRAAAALIVDMTHADQPDATYQP